MKRLTLVLDLEDVSSMWDIRYYVEDMRQLSDSWTYHLEGKMVRATLDDIPTKTCHNLLDGTNAGC